MKLLRKLFILFLLLSIVYILIFIGINFIFQEKLKEKIEKTGSKFFNAQLDIKGFKTDLLTKVSFKDIHLKREDKDFYLNSPEINFKYHPLSLFRNSLRGKIEFKDLFISYKDLKIKEDVLIDFSLSPKIFHKILEIEEFSLYLRETPTLKAKGKLQPILKPQQLFLQTQILSLSYPSFNLKDLNLTLDLSKEKFFAEFLIRALSYKKLRLNNISSKIISQNKKIQLKDLKADIFEGRLSGELNFSFLSPPGYNFNLKMTNLNLKEIIQKFAPQNFRAKGEISLDLEGRVKEGDLKDLRGRLYSQRPGVINTKAIKKLLSQAKISIDTKIFKEGVFFYEDLKGEISLLKDEIIIKLVLEGREAKLKFDINIEDEVLYSFLLRGGQN